MSEGVDDVAMCPWIVIYEADKRPRETRARVSRISA